MRALGVAADADGAVLAHPPLSSCCAARFLTGRGPVPVCGLGVGDPCCRGLLEGVCHVFNLTSLSIPNTMEAAEGSR